MWWLGAAKPGRETQCAQNLHWCLNGGSKQKSRVSGVLQLLLMNWCCTKHRLPSPNRLFWGAVVTSEVALSDWSLCFFAFGQDKREPLSQNDIVQLLESLFVGPAARLTALQLQWCQSK